MNGVMCTCGVCGAKFQFGPHVYLGRKSKTYGIMICHSCWQANWDGWAPHLEDNVTAKLKQDGTPLPSRNERDLLPRGD